MINKMNLIKKSLLTEGLTGALILICCSMEILNAPDILTTVFVFISLFMIFIPIGVKMLCIGEEEDEMCTEHTIKAKSKTYGLLKYIFIFMVIISKNIDPLICLAIMLISKCLLFIHYERCGD